MKLSRIFIYVLALTATPLWGWPWPWSGRSAMGTRSRATSRDALGQSVRGPVVMGRGNQSEGARGAAAGRSLAPSPIAGGPTSSDIAAHLPRVDGEGRIPLVVAEDSYAFLQAGEIDQLDAESMIGKKLRIPTKLSPLQFGDLVFGTQDKPGSVTRLRTAYPAMTQLKPDSTTEEKAKIANDIANVFRTAAANGTTLHPEVAKDMLVTMSYVHLSALLTRDFSDGAKEYKNQIDGAYQEIVAAAGGQAAGLNKSLGLTPEEANMVERIKDLGMASALTRSLLPEYASKEDVDAAYNVFRDRTDVPASHDVPTFWSYLVDHLNKDLTYESATDTIIYEPLHVSTPVKPGEAAPPVERLQVTKTSDNNWDRTQLEAVVKKIASAMHATGNITIDIMTAAERLLSPEGGGSRESTMRSEIFRMATGFRDKSGRRQVTVDDFGMAQEGGEPGGILDGGAAPASYQSRQAWFAANPVGDMSKWSKASAAGLLETIHPNPEAALGDILDWGVSDPRVPSLFRTVIGDVQPSRDGITLGGQLVSVDDLIDAQKETTRKLQIDARGAINQYSSDGTLSLGDRARASLLSKEISKSSLMSFKPGSPEFTKVAVKVAALTASADSPTEVAAAVRRMQSRLGDINPHEELMLGRIDSATRTPVTIDSIFPADTAPPLDRLTYQLWSQGISRLTGEESRTLKMSNPGQDDAPSLSDPVGKVPIDALTAGARGYSGASQGQAVTLIEGLVRTTGEGGDTEYGFDNQTLMEIADGSGGVRYLLNSTAGDSRWLTAQEAASQFQSIDAANRKLVRDPARDLPPTLRDALTSRAQINIGGDAVSAGEAFGSRSTEPTGSGTDGDPTGGDNWEDPRDGVEPGDGGELMGRE